MNNHVPKLDTCKRLKELGYTGPALNIMQVQILPDGSKRIEFVNPVDAWYRVKDSSYGKNEYSWYAAPLATELLEILKPSNTNHEIFYKAQDKKWYIFVPKNSVANESCGVQVANGENFAECLAQRIIQLVEHKIVSFEKEKV